MIITTQPALRKSILPKYPVLCYTILATCIVVAGFSGAEARTAQADLGARQNQLRQAIEVDDSSTVAKIVANSVSAYETIHVGEARVPTLAYAISVGARSVARRLIALGFSPAGRYSGHGVMALALSTDDPELICDLVNAGADWKEEEDRGRRLPHIAAIVNAQKCIERFSELRPQEFPRDVYGRTPLHYAAILDNDSLLEKLLEITDRPLGAIAKQDNGGLSGLHMSLLVGSRRATEVIVKHLNSPMHEAAIRDSILASTSRSGRLPIHLAARQAWLDIVHQMQFWGTPTGRDHRGWSPQDYLVHGRSMHILQLFESFPASAERRHEGTKAWTRADPPTPSQDDTTAVRMSRLPSIRGRDVISEMTLSGNSVSVRFDENDLLRATVSTEVANLIRTCIQEELEEAGLSCHSPAVRLALHGELTTISIKSGPLKGSVSCERNLFQDLEPQNGALADTRVAWAVLRSLILEIPSFLSQRVGPWR